MTPATAKFSCQLRKDGYAIESERQPFHGEANGVRYFLRPVELVPGAHEPNDKPQLIAAGGSSPYDPYSEWA